MAPTVSGRRGLEHSTGAALAKVAAHLSTVEYRLNQPGGNELPRPPLENLDTERPQVELTVARDVDWLREEMERLHNVLRLRGLKRAQTPEAAAD